jgi:hypothetical protein
MKSFLFVLAFPAIFGLAIAGEHEDHLPSFMWDPVEKSDDGIPLLHIRFPDGGPSDVAHLKRFNPIAKLEREKEEDIDNCIFNGFLRDGGNSVVLTGGCPFEDNFEMSLTSKRLKHRMFDVKNGVVEGVESIWSSGFTDEVVTPDDVPTEQLSEGTSRGPIPSAVVMDMKVHYDASFKEHFGEDSVNEVRAILAHAQEIFYWDSLITRIRINVVDIQPIEEDIDAGKEYLKMLRKYGTDPEVDANVFICVDKLSRGSLVGIAYGRTMCGDSPRSRLAIAERVRKVTTSAEIICHELGHNMGLKHDFTKDEAGNRAPRYDSQGNDCQGLGGVMDYMASTLWTSCSNEFLQAYYDNHSDNFCLAEDK